MNSLNNIQHVLEKIFYSFPFQLLINHFKKNQILLIIWLGLFAIVNQNFGMVFGIPYLFLDPEYMHDVNYKGFIIIGISLAILITSFHITTYILDSFRFPFLGTIRKPFSKFCINNSIIPTAFTIFYIYNVATFQFNNGFQTKYEIWTEIIMMILSLFLTLSIIFFYFMTTNKDVYKEIASNVNKTLRKNAITRVNVLRKINNAKKNKYKVLNYIDLNGKITDVSLFNTYDKNTLLKVFDQNHLNAVIFEVFIIAIIILLGLFRDYTFFQIPAAASATLFLAIIIMFTGAFSYWLRGWAITTLIFVGLLLNLLIKHEIINSAYQAFGLNYNNVPADYSLESLNDICSSKNYYADYSDTQHILENWRKKFPGDKKPRMIFVCTSGGGQRAAVWTTRTLQYVDSAVSGSLMRNTVLMTGASGGIIGAGYYRELYRRKLEGETIALHHKKYFENISKDILNPIIFSLVVNDLFFKVQKFSDGKYEYLKDRGYAFEQQLDHNTEHVLNKPIGSYQQAEASGKIPLMIISPTVINDGRKLYISPQPISYMTRATSHNQRALDQKIKGIEFTRFFKNHDAANLNFLSALRMSATFPYITPNVELPSTPTMEIMDAGLTDNFGIHDAVKFLFVFKDWINENTSGVIFVVIRDSEKEIPIEKKPTASIYQKIFSPIGGLYNTWDYLQDFNNDDLLEFTNTWFKGNFNVINFEYIPGKSNLQNSRQGNITSEEMKKISERAALSWHLTNREKISLRKTILESNNQNSLLKLKSLLN